MGGEAGGTLGRWIQMRAVAPRAMRAPKNSRLSSTSARSGGHAFAGHFESAAAEVVEDAGKGGGKVKKTESCHEEEDPARESSQDRTEEKGGDQSIKGNPQNHIGQGGIDVDIRVVVLMLEPGKKNEQGGTQTVENGPKKSCRTSHQPQLAGEFSRLQVQGF